MEYSLNQIEQACRKAVRGAGLDWGSAEDAGRGIRWLEWMNLDGIKTLLRVLQLIDHTQGNPIQTREMPGVWTGSNGLLSPLIAGPALADLINARNLAYSNEKFVIELKNIACPLLCAGYLGTAANQANCVATLVWGEVEIICGAQPVVGAEEQQVLYPDTTPNLTITFDRHSVQPEPVAGSLPEIGSRYVDSTSWHQLEKFVHITYVEATEASRLAGAGAGTSDND